ncbi:hypothetical protein CO683_26985 [Bradyrhizobium ottawaense]|nr:hypothetical protein CO683_26985 [Bradyrhizobium ottawaense]
MAARGDVAFPCGEFTEAPEAKTSDVDWAREGGVVFEATLDPHMANAAITGAELRRADQGVGIFSGHADLVVTNKVSQLITSRYRVGQSAISR